MQSKKKTNKNEVSNRDAGKYTHIFVIRKREKKTVKIKKKYNNQENVMLKFLFGGFLL